MDSTAKLRSATPEEQFQEVTRAAVDLHVEKDLRARLQKAYDTGVPLRVKAGFDPTAPDLHLGHTVLLSRMRRFQQFGHTVIFLIGDFTGLIGDPTGRNSTRPPLTPEQIAQNAETYKKQVFKILDPAATEVRYNSEWLGAMGFADVIRLASRYTVARMLERDDFKKRYTGNVPISVHEFLYPLAQAYDSVALKADVELGSSDQLFNLLVGRAIMPDYQLTPQIVLTGPILEGLDAKLDPESRRIVGNKMSKSLGNYVGVAEAPEEQFGKLMSVSDDLMWRYYELLSDRTSAEIAALRAGHPKDAKIALAKEIVTRFHGADAATRAEEHFAQVHARREVPDEVEERAVALDGQAALPLARLLADAKVVASGSEARRLIAQGGVSVNGERVSDEKATLGAGEWLVKVGKRRFVRLKLA
ncbi:tyrosine--tRNA ligase [Anaeromyxobacter sp. Fw109-5]|uniref:tyrosine--tRNA ligase n=1 Tax=Anaeromyxobacter sp. (strain Fw109-5) TaxID=404589 RepID=UPI0000ED812D|nr:tyrosine--tRNA ligase [Anaeromyxobacter sp. Fw109-5]ABS25302.1 tyrosyl-tRNA synthetase [Anaeromyxobacter sp. Fw109-5]